MDSSNDTRSAIRSYFGKLGLEAELADIYLALHSHGPQSISELSRNSKVERTRIYRLIDQLLETALVEVESHGKRAAIKAAPVTNLRLLINQREEALRNLHDELGLIEQTLARNSLSNPAMRVQFYYGPEGIRQILRHELQATTPIIGYAGRLVEEVAGKAFSQTYIDNFVSHQLSCRVLVNQDFLSDFQAARKRGLVGGTVTPGISYAEADPEVFHVQQVCRVYNDIIAHYLWKDDEVYGLEIHCQQLADSQRQLLQLAWQQATAITLD